MRAYVLSNTLAFRLPHPIKMTTLVPLFPALEEKQEHTCFIGTDAKVSIETAGTRTCTLGKKEAGNLAAISRCTNLQTRGHREVPPGILANLDLETLDQIPKLAR